MAKHGVSNLLKLIVDTHEESHGCLDCETCNSHFECLAEQVALGASMDEVLLPAVEAHLKCCRDCREEFNALLAVIRAEMNGDITQLIED